MNNYISKYIKILKFYVGKSKYDTYYLFLNTYFSILYELFLYIFKTILSNAVEGITHHLSYMDEIDRIYKVR